MVRFCNGFRYGNLETETIGKSLIIIDHASSVNEKSKVHKNNLLTTLKMINIILRMEGWKVKVALIQV